MRNVTAATGWHCWSRPGTSETAKTIPPCQRLTPLLAQAYNEYKSSGKTDLEIVFCSSDRDQQGFQGYYNSMPWVAMQFNAMEKNQLSQRFNVRGIPHIGVFGPSGQIVAQNGRDTIAGMYERGTRSGVLAQCMAIWHPNSVAAQTARQSAAAEPAPALAQNLAAVGLLSESELQEVVESR